MYSFKCSFLHSAEIECVALPPERLINGVLYLLSFKISQFIELHLLGGSCLGVRQIFWKPLLKWFSGTSPCTVMRAVESTASRPLPEKRGVGKTPKRAQMKTKACSSNWYPAMFSGRYCHATASIRAESAVRHRFVARIHFPFLLLFFK